jgi:hypothetical protein
MPVAAAGATIVDKDLDICNSPLILKRDAFKQTF